MKALLKRSCVLALMLLVALGAFCGCASSQLEKNMDNVSELREHLFAAESADYKLTAISGIREEPYELDGVSSSKRDFTVLTVTPVVFSADKTYRYKTEINGTTYEGDLLPHPFAQSLSADIPATATSDFAVTIICGGEQSFELKNLVQGELIGAEKAFDIALDKLKNELKKFRSKGKLHAEIYVRLMENPIDGNGGYFWYVSFVGEDKVTVAVLLRGDTGAVAATRI